MRNATVVCLLVMAALLLLILGCGGHSDAPIAGARTMHTRSLGSLDYLALSDYHKNPLTAINPNTLSPFVLSHGGQYYMWVNAYYGGALRATSPDGIQWSAFTPCSGLSSTLKRPCVLYNEQLGQFEIWYWNNGNMFHMSGYEHAVSSDGLNWTNRVSCGQYPSPHRPLYSGWSNGIGTYGPSQVFFNPSSTLTEPDYSNPWANRYVMYYDVLRQATNTEALGLAVSIDGITWGVATEGGCVLAPGAAGAWDSKSTGFASVFRGPAGYQMYYGGSRTLAGSGEGIGYATSGDGVNWSKHGQPVLHAGDGVDWRSYTTGSPAVVMVNGRPRVYFSGRSDSQRAAIGFAMIDTTPPVLTVEQPTPNLLWPPQGQTVTVAVGGAAVEDESGLETLALQVEDEYGVASQTIDLLPLVDSAGQFQVSVPLVATREGGDADGRIYSLTVSAADKAGNAATAVKATVVCPHHLGGKPTKK